MFAPVGSSQGTFVPGSPGDTEIELTRSPAAIGNLLIVSFLVSMPNGVPTISDTAGNTWNILNAANQDSTHNTTTMSWYAVANGTGSTTITVLSGTDPQFLSMMLDEFSLDGTPTVDAAASAPDGQSGTPTVSVTVTAGHRLIWQAAFDTITDVGSIGGALATLGAEDGADDATQHWIGTATAGAKSCSMTGSGAYSTIAAAFEETASASAAITGTMHNCDESDIVAGGRTIIVTLTDDEFIA